MLENGQKRPLNFKVVSTNFRDSSDFDDADDIDDDDDDDDVATSDGEFVKKEGRSTFYEPPEPETMSQASVETEVAEFPTTGSKNLAPNSN